MAGALSELIELTVVVDDTFDQNCYVLRRRDTERALVVDPGLQYPRLLEHLERTGLHCDRVLVTHGHGDHVCGVPAVTAAHGCPASIHPADRFLLPHVGMLPGVPDDLPDVVCADDLIPGTVVDWQDVQLAVLHTPGHTPGSVCFGLGGDLWAGDTLFQGSVGRADLPGGDWDTLMASIEHALYALPPATVVHPGHGPRTTVGEEMQFNPFVIHPRYR